MGNEDFSVHANIGKSELHTGGRQKDPPSLERVTGSAASLDDPKDLRLHIRSDISTLRAALSTVAPERITDDILTDMARLQEIRADLKNAPLEVLKGHKDFLGNLKERMVRLVPDPGSED